MLNRESKEYLRQKAAFELLKTEAWEILLKPLLESKKGKTLRKLESLNDAFLFNYELGRAKEDEYILDYVENYAKKFRSN